MCRSESCARLTFSAAAESGTLNTPTTRETSELSKHAVISIETLMVRKNGLYQLERHPRLSKGPKSER